MGKVFKQILDAQAKAADPAERKRRKGDDPPPP
jgi:hypothetical protein